MSNKLQDSFKKEHAVETEQTDRQNKKIVKRIIICLLILFVGWAIMMMLTKLKKPPVETETGEIPIQVDTITVAKHDYPVIISGYGEVRSLNEVPVASEISGKVVAVHPRLEPGEIIPAGELLFKIDDRDFQTAVTIGKERLKVLKKNKDLAEKDYKRVYRLFKENKVGTASGVDMAEKSLMSATDMMLQLEQALEMAEVNLDRCEVRARFNGRVSQVRVEAGQFMAPGQHAVTLVDDAVLEIQVPLDSRNVRDWLPFKSGSGDDTLDNANWFPDVQQVPCVIKWTEENENTWKGRLDRIVLFNPKTRTVTVAVRVEPTPAASFPLVNDMFCRVEIPGRIMKQVIRLPRLAVSFENTVFTVVRNQLKTIQVTVVCEDRLKTVPVTVVREEGDVVYVSEGLKAGDRVITTRLIDPLENTLLSIMNPKTMGEK